jgi:hypothetical protein
MLYYSLEVPGGPEQAAPGTGEMAEALESLVAAWDGEVARARTAEQPPGRPGREEVDELEALRSSHRALVETLEQSISTLETLQQKAAGLVWAASEPAAAPPVEAPEPGLCLTASGPTEFPTTDETDMIDMSNRQALATLDSGVSRWRPLKRRRTIRRASGF